MPPCMASAPCLLQLSTTAECGPRHRYIANRLGFEALTDAAVHQDKDVTDYEHYVSTWVRP